MFLRTKLVNERRNCLSHRHLAQDAVMTLLGSRMDRQPGPCTPAANRADTSCVFCVGHHLLHKVGFSHKCRLTEENSLVKM